MWIWVQVRVFKRVVAQSEQQTCPLSEFQYVSSYCTREMRKDMDSPIHTLKILITAPNIVRYTGHESQWHLAFFRGLDDFLRKYA